jgi:hypothetical protein
MELVSNCVNSVIPSQRSIHVESIKIEWDPSLSIFAREEFLRAVGDEYGWLGGRDESGTLRCILPYTIVRKGGVRMARFRVETISLGGELDIADEKLFLNCVVEYFRKHKVDIIIPASTNTIFRTYPSGAIAAPYGTFFISLSRPEDVLWSAMSSTHRRHVRSAEKSGVRIRHAQEHVARAHEIIRDTFKKSSMAFMSREDFVRMIAGLEGNVHLLVAECNNDVQCCAVIAYSNRAAYYMYGGSIPQSVSGAMHLLHWEAIRLYRGLGVLRYDFCGARISPEPGSKAAGLATFKERFGANLDQGYMWKYSLSPLKPWIYSLGVRFLKGGDIVDAERHKLNAQ